MKDGLIPECNLSYKQLLSGKWTKYSEPVLRRGSSNSFDEKAVASPFILEKSEGEYFLYYMAQNKTGNKWNTGLARSNDLVNWKKFDANPILTEDMIKWGKKPDGPFITNIDNTYYLFYEATSSQHWFYSFQERIYGMGLGFIAKVGLIKKIWNLFIYPALPQAAIHTYNRGIGFATSSDGIIWHENNRKPIFIKDKNFPWESQGVFAPKIYKVNGRYWMYYSGSNGREVCTGLAFSPDLRVWKKYEHNPVLHVGDKGAYDERCAEIISIIKIADGYVSFYECEDSKNFYRVGMAYSNDLINWEKFTGGPAINIGSQGSFDDKAVLAPHAVVKDDKLHLFYSAFNANDKGSIGLALFE